jgi:hypothetical protein
MGDVAQMGETRNANWILEGTYEGENLKDLDVCGTPMELIPKSHPRS